MRNLLEETLKCLKENGLELHDVRWIGCEKFQMPISEFIEKADTEYDSGYGSQEVATDLLVVGDYFWLERHEYDGCEWWEYKTMPKKPKEMRTNVKIIDRGYSYKSLEKLQEESE